LQILLLSFILLLAEKAYAQINESEWISQDNTNSYQGIAYGWDSYSVKHITGLNSTDNYLNFNAMVDAFKNGSMMGVSSYSSGVASNIVANHVYTVAGYNASTQEFTLFNPWGVQGGNGRDG
jgi:hypothetical protein